MSASWCSVMSTGVRLSVHIMPNAKRTEVIGELDGALKIRLQAPPIEGKANDALVRYIAHALHVPKTKVTITHGLSSKRKIIEVAAPHLSALDIEAALIPKERS